jgi:hypothetical protein
MSTPPSVPNINIKPKASLNQLEFYWNTPASTGVNQFTPPNIPGLQLWIDANDNSTLNVINGNDVRQVTDKVNNVVYKPIQDINGQFLRLQTNQINGLQALWFNNQFSNNVFLQGNLNMPVAGCAFIVFTALEQLTPVWRGIFGSNKPNCPSFTYLNGQNNVIAPCISFNNIPGSPTNTVEPGKTYLIYFAWQASNTSVGLFGNQPTTGNNPITVTQSGSILRLAKDTTSCANMNLGEFLIFDNTLTNNERHKMEGYLAWKWGLNSQLPNSHPYWTNDPRSGIAPLQGYTLGCQSLGFQSTYSASTNYALVSSNSLQASTDYTFGLSAFNLNGSSITALYQITQRGNISAGPRNVLASSINASTVNVSWSFSTNTGEANVKWFIITAIPSTNTVSTLLKSVFSTERQRAITGLSSNNYYTFAVQAVNNVGYSYITPLTTSSSILVGVPPVLPGLLVHLNAVTYSGSGTWFDSSINGKNATLEDGTIAKNAQGNGIILNGSTSWTFPNISAGNSWTIGMWYMNTGGYFGQACILTQIYTSTINLALGYIAGANPVGAFFTGGFRKSTAISLTLNTWTNIQITWDGTNMQTYINGSLLGTTTPGGIATDAGSNYRIGRRWDSNEYVTGVIGALKIYNRALTQSEVTQEYNTTAAIYA